MSTPQQAGIFVGLPEDKYFAAEGISQSLLKEMYCSPAHALAYLTEPRKPDTEAQLFGKITHRGVFEPSLMGKVAVKPKGMSFATTEGKAWKAAHAGSTIMPFEAFNDSQRMIKAVHAHAAAGALLKLKARKEVSVFAIDDETGLMLKGRFDFLPDNNSCIIDLKTTLDSSPKYPGFLKQIAKYRYFVQAAFYLDLAARAGLQIPTFIFIAAEKNAPYAVTCFQLDDLSISKGRSEYRRLLTEFAGCNKTKDYPAYSDKVEIVTIPEWCLKDEPYESAFAYTLETT